ncbi:MAG: hypothetical protein JWM00_341 [Candidatus Saccharibacteria bacterium]|nr:hypothetical protein [Candidatus Saccharibacteria bacterium]
MQFYKKKKTADMPRRRKVSSIQQQRIADNELAERNTFRRNRTLTGSSSSKIVSSSEGSAQLKSPRVHVHHLALKRRQVGMLLSVIVLITLGLYLLINQFTASTMVSVKNTPQNAALQALYDPIIQEYYGQHPIERLRFLTNERTFLGFMQSKAPEIESVAVEASSQFATSQFIIIPRKPITGWTISGSQQFVDANGTAFSRNYYAAPQVQIVDNSGVPVTAGQAVASNRFLGFVGRLVGFAQQRGYTVEQVVIPSGTTRQLDLKIAGISYLVKCSIDRSAGEQAEDLDRSIKHLQQRGMTPSFIDVRVGGKAFYQ